MSKFFKEEFCNPKYLVTTLRLVRTRNIGPVTFLKLVSKYKDPQNALSAVSEILKSKGLLKELISETQAEEEISQVHKFGAKIISIFDRNYPDLLSEIYDPPIIISYSGDLKITKGKAVAIVGSRNASANGMSLTYKLSTELAEADFTIISGLAKGIDAAAHKAVIDSKISAKTVAVIAGGIDNIYPKENHKLFHEIAEKGLIISENPFGALPKSESFPRRNRIISGLSLGVLVVEAAIKSGSLITAKFASEQGREVFCIPGFPLDGRSEGPNDLIKKGANLVTASNDIINCLKEMDASQVIARNQSNLLFEDGDAEFEILSDIQNEDSSSQIKYEESAVKNISSDIVIKNLSFTPVEIDTVMRQANISSSELSSILLELEISGEITRHPGNRISRAA